MKNRLYVKLVELEGKQVAHLLLETIEMQVYGKAKYPKDFLKGAIFVTEVADNFEL